MSCRTITYTLDGDALRHLVAADRQLGRLITEIGDYTLELRGNHFVGLARAVVGQQLSVAAARSIWRRIEAQPSLLDVGALAAAEPSVFAGTGLSGGKAACLCATARAIADGRLKLDAFAQASDTEIVEVLSGIKGIGRWTAEMYLIFALGREDVLAIGDAGLRRAAGLLLTQAGAQMEPDRLAVAAAPWRPYRTAASLYLWRGLDLGLLA